MDIVQFFGLLRRRFALILVCLIAGTAGGVFYTHHAKVVYKATAQTLLSVPDTTSVGEQIGGDVLTSQQINTWAAVATSRAVAQRVIDQLGLQATPSRVADHLSAVVERSTAIIDITASSGTPLSAKALADAGAQALADEIDALQVNQGGRVAARLLDAAEVPTKPSSPNKPLAVTLGFILGLLGGFVLSAALDAADRTVKTTSQGDALFGAPLLALIPRRRGKMLVVRRDSRSTDAEHYRTLRTAVRFVHPDSPIRTLVVTSAVPGDGKTITASNLAVAMALSGERVVLVDADLRRAQVAKTFGLDGSVGLTSLVLGTCSLNDALQQWDPGLLIMPSGPLPPNPSEILGSQLFNQVLQQLVAIADIVIIDTPPVLPVTDALALATQVDGVLLVARQGKTLRSGAAEARRKLNNVGAHIVGYVLNAVPPREAQQYYAEYEYKGTGPTLPVSHS